MLTLWEVSGSYCTAVVQAVSAARAVELAKMADSSGGWCTAELLPLPAVEGVVTKWYA
jgi:dihydroorotase-like cyclic amidohydrolase